MCCPEFTLPNWLKSSLDQIQVFFGSAAAPAPKDLKQKLQNCTSFDQLCDFHDHHKDTDGYADLFRDSQPVVFFYEAALKGKGSFQQNMNKIDALENRFGIFWIENVLDAAITNSGYSMIQLSDFCKNKLLLITRSKELEIVERIKAGKIIPERLEWFFDLFKIIKTFHNDHSCYHSIIDIVEAILEHLSSNHHRILAYIVDKPDFSAIWKWYLMEEKSKLPNELLLLVQNLSTKSSITKNRFMTALTSQSLTEIGDEIKKRFGELASNQTLILPNSSEYALRPINYIHVGGVCQGFTYYLAKEVLDIWNTHFPTELQTLAEKHFMTAPREAYINHLLYSNACRIQRQWTRILTQAYIELKTSSSQVRMVVLALICTAYGISQEKISAFIERIDCEKTDIALLERLFEKNLHPVVASLKQCGTIDENSLSVLAKELGIQDSEEITEIVQILQGFYFARKLFREKTKRTFFDKNMNSIKLIALKLYRGKDNMDFMWLLNRAIYKLSGLFLEKPMTLQVTDDFDRWQKWVENAADGVYQLLVPQHAICLAKKESYIYILDPMSLLSNEKKLKYCHIEDKYLVKEFFKFISLANPSVVNDKPWEFSRVKKWESAPEIVET